MIAGETEILINRATTGEPYDNFLFFGKKKKRKPLTPEEKEAKKQKRKAFWQDVKNQFKEGETVSNIINLFDGDNTADIPSDYDINIGTEQESPEENSKGIPTGIWLIGGVVAVTLAVYGYSRYRKKVNK